MEECAAYSVTKYTVVNGVMTPHVEQIQGRKVPLASIRHRLLMKHLKYMRLTPDTTITAMTKEQLAKRLNVKGEEKSEDEFCQLLIHSEKTHSLCMWHDHTTMA